MIQFKVYIVGKAKDSWIDSGITSYAKRMKGTVDFKWVWLKSNEQLELVLSKETAVIALDPKGQMMTSEAFSSYLMQSVQNAGSRIAFVIGGADGLPMSIREKYSLLSLSSMTWTHQMTRLLLAEQIYRAFEIAKGSPYHK
jgi:23S rRNA (pseudouridine1915-N3)-methyltransferase